MAEKVKGVWVAFEQDLDEETSLEVIAAIKCIRLVADAETCVANYDDWINRQQIRSAIRADMLALYNRIGEIR